MVRVESGALQARSRARTVAFLAVIGLVAAAVVVIVLRPSLGGRHSSDGSITRTSIPVDGGVHLQALLVRPQASSVGSLFPLIIIPAGWGQDEAKYGLLAERLAADGYEVLAYTQRGQVDSGGQIDFAGEKTQADVSRVIDWALAHTRVDAKEIGMLGTSYGGGISLLASAHDRRIRAVVATSTWTNLAESLIQNDTVSAQTLTSLFTGVRLDAQLQQLHSKLVSNPQAFATAFAKLCTQRSPQHFIDQLNHNRPAIMLANAYEDRVLAPRQLISFYNALTTPKRLQLAPGDHAGPEYPGLLGRPDTTIADAQAWFDHYLRGRNSLITRQAPIELQDVRTGAWRGYFRWPTASARDAFVLARPGSDAIGTRPSGWSATIAAGLQTVATSGDGLAFPPIRANLNALSPRYAASWSGPKLDTATQITGAGSLHLLLGSSSPSTTVFVYLYDVALSGYGTLMSVTPYTATGLTPGTPRALTIGLQPITWTLPASHHVEVVIDTVDPRYHSTAKAGSTVTFSSTATDPATVTIPVS